MKSKNLIEMPVGSDALFATAASILGSADARYDNARRAYMEDNARIGGLMRVARERTGMSLREVARQLSLSAPYVSDLERGNRIWSNPRLIAYAVCLANANPELPQ